MYYQTLKLPEISRLIEKILHSNWSLSFSFVFYNIIMFSCDYIKSHSVHLGFTSHKGPRIYECESFNYEKRENAAPVLRNY